jgi:hypothetical protein
MTFTQITAQVISANAINSSLVANNTILTRHIITGAVSADKLAANVSNFFTTANAVNTVQNNLASVSANFVAYAVSANANIDLVQSNAYSNDYTTLLSAYSNDSITLLFARANDYTTLTSAFSNDGTTLGLAYSNDATTLSTARSNDYTTLLSAYSNDYSTLLSASSNDYSTYITLLGAISASNTSVSSLQGGIAGSNTRIINLESNVSNLQVGISGSNTRIINLESNVANLQVGISGSNTRISGSESNVITLQTFATGAQSNIASIITGSSQFTGNVTMQKSLTVQGNLYVIGSQVDLGVGSTSIYDAIITLNANLNSSTPPPADAGILINRGNLDNVFIGTETTDPHIKFIYTNSPGSNTIIAVKDYIDIVANAFHANASSQTQPAFGFYSDQNTGVHFPQPDTITLVTGGIIQANVTSEGNLILTSGHVSSHLLKNFIDLETDRFANSISLGSVTNIALFLDTNNNGTDDFFAIYNDTNDMGQNVDSAILSVRNDGTLYSKSNLNYISSNATTDVYSGNSIISSKVYSNGIELRSNDYATYLVALGGITGANTAITNLQSGLTGSNTRLSGAESNVISLQGGISGSNTAILNLQTGLSGTNTNLSDNVAIFVGAFIGSNTRLSGAESNVISLQGGLTGSNTRITGAESNVIALQGGLSGSNANIYSTYTTLTSNDYVTYTRLNANLNTVSSNTDSKLSLSGGTISGNIAMGAKHINNLADPIQAQDAATRAYVLAQVGGTTLVQQYTTNISSGSSNVIAISINNPVTITRVLVSLSGVIQTPTIDFIHNAGNSSIQYTVDSLPAGLTTVIQSWA